MSVALTKKHIFEQESWVRIATGLYISPSGRSMTNQSTEDGSPTNKVQTKLLVSCNTVH